MRKQFLVFVLLSLFLIALASYAYAETCQSTPVQYYGFCEPQGNIQVYDEQGNLVEQQLYSSISGCTKNIFRIVVSGGTGCTVEEGETIVFKIGGKVAQAVAWHAASSSIQTNLSTSGRTFVFVNDEGEDDTPTNTTVEDEEGVDLTKYGTSSGGGGGGASTPKTAIIVANYDGDDIGFVKFNTTTDSDKTVDFNLDNNAVYVNLGQTEFSEILVPAVKGTDALYVCFDSETMDCEDKLLIEMGSKRKGLYLEPDYRTIGDKKFYVLHGLTNGSAQEVDRPIWVLTLIVSVGAILIVAGLLAKYQKSKNKKRK